MELTDAFTVPGAAAGAIALTQFIKVLWSRASGAQLKVVAALSGVGIVAAVQWGVVTGSAQTAVGVLLSGVMAGLAATAGFDQIKASFAGD